MSAAAQKTKLKSVNRANPCELCGADHKCSRGEDGLILCGRKSGPIPGYIWLGQCKGDEQFGMYRREGDPQLDQPSHRLRWQGHSWDTGMDDSSCKKVIELGCFRWVSV
jgi:hypothetical protein